MGAGTAVEWIASGRPISAAEAGLHGLAQSAPDATQGMQALERMRTMAGRRVAATLAQIRDATQMRSPGDDAGDLARLVRPAARPGLKLCIAAYRASLRKQPK